VSTPEKTPADLKVSLLENYNKHVPHIMKYMGSKREILDFIVEAIDDLYQGQKVCDLFAGTSILSGAIGQEVTMHSNDIQQYSRILSKTYLSSYDWDSKPNIIEDVILKAKENIQSVKDLYPKIHFSYDGFLTIEEFQEIEKKQQALQKTDFSKSDYHLFIKTYSGTYWSFEQCLWIDAIRKAAEDYSYTAFYYPILSSLIYAMAYTSQSTGHYAQYRDATKRSNKEDILIYRRKEIEPFFRKKFLELKTKLVGSKRKHVITTLDYTRCLDQIDDNTIVYADPPYAFVHYSRFYHALETLVKYDYPKVSHKGRYREDRHQSPFCQRTNVRSAFEILFQKIKEKNAQLILSYSDTGMIGQDELINMLNLTLDSRYEVEVRFEKHMHSTMGRSDIRDNEVNEFLIIAKHK
jgi:adenine-specific DNA-methyltransferase